jgi:hypothetical protein
MIDTIAAIDCDFNDWGQEILNLTTNTKHIAIYSNISEFSKLGFSNFDNSAGFLYIYPSDKDSFKVKDKIKIDVLDKVVILEKITSEASGVIKAELSLYEDEQFNGYSFSE